MSTSSTGTFVAENRLGRGSKAFLAAIFLIGVAVTVLAAQALGDQRIDRDRESLSAGSEVISSAANDALTEAIAASQRVALLTVAEWPSAAQFNTEFLSRTSAIPGDSAAVVVLRVDDVALDGLVAAEVLEDPSFDEIVGDEEPSSSHLLVMRSTSPEVAAGVHLSSRPGLAQRLEQIPMVGIHVFAGDLRGETPDGEQMQLIVRSKAAGPDGARYDSWTIVQVDLPALFDGVEGAAGADFAAGLAFKPIGPVASFATGPSNDGETIEKRIPVGPVELDVTVWVDTQPPGISASTIVVLGGVLAAAVLTFISYLLLAVVANRRTARIRGLEARRDHLTGIANRRWAVEHLQGLRREPVAVLFCDLDRFKVVNDSAGHGAGDVILVQVVERLETVLDEHCRLARFGGDEFLVVCSGVDDVDAHAARIAARINEVTREPFRFGDGEFTTTISIGIASSDGSTETVGEELIRAADVALGMCKQRGRDGSVLYDESLREAELGRLEFEGDLRAALDSGDFVMHYQPIVDSQQRVVSFEALVRWDRAGALLAPGSFLPVVEEIGRLCDLGRIVLRTAVAEFAAGVGDTRRTTLHVNVDAAQLVDSEYPAFVAAVLADHDLHPNRLVLELTEGEWADSIDGIMPTLEALSTLGVRLAIDDFGAGYSNIGRALAVSGLGEVKLDRSLVVSLDRERNHAFFTGFTDTLLQLGVLVVAEGIETHGMFEVARRTGANLFQGFYFARPNSAVNLDFSAEVLTPELAPSSDGGRRN